MTAPIDILSETDRCVLCGLCLPRCPTYTITQNENDSPRGRIALVRALAQQKLPASKILARHLNSCLSCRACEKSCPANVSYIRILDYGRALLAAEHLTSWWQRAVAKLSLISILWQRKLAESHGR